MTMSFPRRQLLTSLRERPADRSPKNIVARWAISKGFATEHGMSQTFEVTSHA